MPKMVIFSDELYPYWIGREEGTYVPPPSARTIEVDEAFLITVNMIREEFFRFQGLLEEKYNAAD